ncbi:hypothetical protein Pmani_018453 [Petrolisthes manimaculis]|uniref:Ig-like domain-containing protein n=1 Tax=Petrolisthes manimaculis TaxID=1843537 RepID=A0AAE1U8R8_9EUCA|nr:hypothetical protein Pmani_018453 [Petrolisthes manimaculis]
MIYNQEVPQEIEIISVATTERDTETEAAAVSVGEATPPLEVTKETAIVDGAASVLEGYPLTLSCTATGEPELDVRLVSPPSKVSGGRHYNLTCQASGSMPPPTLTWWLRGKKLKQKGVLECFGAFFHLVS